MMEPNQVSQSHHDSNFDPPAYSDINYSDPPAYCEISINLEVARFNNTIFH